MITCKNCNCTNTVKNGKVRFKQRYKCSNCGFNFVFGDGRIDRKAEIKKALCVILYALGKASFGFLGKLFGVSRSTTYNWIKKIAGDIEDPKVGADIKEIEFDEMWHFIGSKKTKNGSLRRWTVVQGELLPGLLVVVMLTRSDDCTISSNT